MGRAKEARAGRAKAREGARADGGRMRARAREVEKGNRMDMEWRMVFEREIMRRATRGDDDDRIAVTIEPQTQLALSLGFEEDLFHIHDNFLSE